MAANLAVLSRSCSFTYASVSLVSNTREEDVGHVVAATLLPAFSLNQPSHKHAKRIQPLPLAWIFAPNQALPDSRASSGNDIAQSSSSGSSSSTQEGPQRRFPRPPWIKDSDEQPGTSTSSSSTSDSNQPSVSKNKLRTRRSGENPHESSAICIESSNGRERVYCVRKGVESGKPWEAFDMVDDPQTHQGRVMAVVKSYLLPQGFPDSVAPQYATYMGWRGVQYFFGGAISVFTTKSLLGALGVAGRRSGEAAAAINWVLKDGAGRLGRFLFARWGRELDCELKQFRLAGDILMEAGAALELSTVLAPRAFLPLACTANLAKNLAAVAASSTRAPIYRTFALSNNLADVTAKGESVANLADILGTLAGIALSNAKLPMVPTFCFLSCGYLVASRMEVDAVELPYLNRARLAYTATRFLSTGQVPGIAEANHREPLLPWGRYHQGKVVLGSRVEQACCTPADLTHAAGLYKNERFIMTYRPDTKKVYVLLKDGAQPMDSLKAAFSAHVFLHMLEQQEAAAGTASTPAASTSQPSTSSSSTLKNAAAKRGAAEVVAGSSSSSGDVDAAAEAVNMIKDATQRLKQLFFRNPGGSREAVQQLLEGSKVATDQLYQEFKREADKLGWKLSSTMLNPGEARLLKVTPLTAA